MGVVPFADAAVVTAFPEFQVSVPRIGAGKQKAVYRAKSEAVELALKILLMALDRSDPDAEPDPEYDVTLERFKRETQGMQRVDCPHVMRLIDEPAIREIDGSNYYWYTEPLIGGGTLKARIKSGPLPLDELDKLARSLLTAVEAMSTTGQFVHRDIKPNNILFTDDGTVVLTDLGIARFTELQDITESEMTGPGTWMYAAPEQFDIRKMANIDFRTDMFQVGIVLFEAAMGKHPFNPSNITGYAERLRSFHPNSITRTDLPAGLRKLIIRLLSPNPSGRYRRVSSAFDDLDGQVQ
ncbi:hypothetical protein K875_01170 [Mycobacterium [tuberculosis] TKK-01-0051]|uniref:non-specific serine/threonine protein kinase n=1 Tax=Mycobacterium [tuberculosis] TKK-01-0051 TaxID=1324261 RepID=A0A051UHA0_9MYCO|nr:serine/threonine-protein kinase [Mycobacterium colombiense]KBZ68614.1 hypothetical protein K875_01170 [Mycobacterium [tuberculosis] TKK-01-0051]